jgi:hypothetical protein
MDFYPAQREDTLELDATVVYQLVRTVEQLQSHMAFVLFRLEFLDTKLQKKASSIENTPSSQTEIMQDLEELARRLDCQPLREKVDFGFSDASVISHKSDDAVTAIVSPCPAPLSAPPEVDGVAMPLCSSEFGQVAWAGQYCEEVETRRLAMHQQRDGSSDGDKKRFSWPQEQNSTAISTSSHNLHSVSTTASICGSLENVSPNRDATFPLETRRAIRAAFSVVDKCTSWPLGDAMIINSPKEMSREGSSSGDAVSI